MCLSLRPKENSKVFFAIYIVLRSYSICLPHVCIRLHSFSPVCTRLALVFYTFASVYSRLLPFALVSPFSINAKYRDVVRMLFNVPLLRDDLVIKGSGSFLPVIQASPGFLKADFLHAERPKYSEKVGKI